MHRVDADEITHQIVARAGARYRQSGKHVAAGLREIFPAPLAHVLLEYIECGTAIEGDDDVLLAAGDGVSRTDWRAALRKPRRDHDVVGEHHARQAAFGNAVRDL